MERSIYVPQDRTLKLTTRLSIPNYNASRNGLAQVIVQKSSGGSHQWSISSGWFRILEPGEL